MTLFLFPEEKRFNANSIMISKKCSKIKTLSGDDPPSSSLISIFGKSSDRERVSSECGPVSVSVACLDIKM